MHCSSMQTGTRSSRHIHNTNKRVMYITASPFAHISTPVPSSVWWGAAAPPQHGQTMCTGQAIQHVSDGDRILPQAQNRNSMPSGRAVKSQGRVAVFGSTQIRSCCRELSSKWGVVLARKSVQCAVETDRLPQPLFFCAAAL